MFMAINNLVLMNSWKKILCMYFRRIQFEGCISKDHGHGDTIWYKKRRFIMWKNIRSCVQETNI
ncbi:hypothetical protein Hanom_Chr11g01054931 [Helianthus anomalus]